MRNGKIVANTEHKDCMPDKETLLSMKKAGLSFRLDGKAYNPFARENQKNIKKKHL
jgi:hypothetical protein